MKGERKKYVEGERQKNNMNQRKKNMKSASEIELA